MTQGPLLPEHPELRRVAEVLEEAQLSGEILDHRWRIAFISTEQLRIVGLDPETRERYYGISPIVRAVRFIEDWGQDPESGRDWWRALGPVLRHDVSPDDPDFEAVFAQAADVARKLEPAPPPIALTMRQTFPGLERFHETWLGAVRFVYLRLCDAEGRFIGTLMLSGPEIPQSLATRLARGDRDMYELMDRLREPQRRSAAILFADLEASGEVSRRLSSLAYFELIRSLTDLIDGEVAARSGVLGKHAGDGASALFLAGDGSSGEKGAGDFGESGAARAAMEAARAIRDGASELLEEGPEVGVNVGIHWGATLTVGQVSTRGRLEVTALGDEMNEAARIESAATDGTALASKNLIERLSAADAEALSLDPGSITYRTLAELSPGEKALRDAGTIPVCEI